MTAMQSSRSAILLILLLAPLTSLAALACSITTAGSCTSPSVTVMRLSAGSNAHAELPNQSTAAYANNVMCCSGVTNLGNSCTGTFATVAKLSSVTNAHVQQNSQTGYGNNVCLSAPAGGSVAVAYQASNCSGYDTTLGSLSAATNAQIGGANTYATKICATAAAAAESLTFSVSDTSVGFGGLVSSGARYGTGDTTGSLTETGAHTMDASTNSSTGYMITVQGPTLTSGGNTISAIGGTNTAPVASIEQFGLRATATGGSGSVTAPYAASGFAYAATATTPSQVAGATVGDSVTTTYSVRYVANIGPQTETGSYTTSLVYTITANF